MSPYGEPVSISPHADLDFLELDPAATQPEQQALVHAYGDAWSHAFLEGAMNEEQRSRWLEDSRADRACFRAAVPRRQAVGPRVPVATFSSWDGRMNVGGPELLGLRMITDVTVAPTHRRRGLLTRLMTDDLDAAAAAGLPLAGLTVSEGGIYGRFGFGPATRSRRVEIDARPGRLRLREYDDAGSLEAASPADAWPVVERIFTRHLARTRGEVVRPASYAPMLSGAWDFEEGSGPDRALRAVLHLSAEGEPDGYVLFRVKEVDGEGHLAVLDLVALTPGGHLRLWELVAGIDLVTVVRGRLTLDDPLDHAVLDPRAIRTVRLQDLLWLRLLDLPAALQGRPWREDGSVVLEVDDPLGHVAGTWRVTTRGGEAAVERVAGDPEVRLSAETLATLYLGDRRVAPLVAAGRVSGPGAATFAAMIDDAGPLPDCRSGF